MFQLEDTHKVCFCVALDYPAGCPQNVFVCSTWLSCSMSTKCVFVSHVNLLQNSTICVRVFRMTVLQDVHELCLCVPLDSPAGCPHKVFIRSSWISWRIPTKRVFVLLLTTPQDVHKMCLCVPHDSPAGCLRSVFTCSIWLSCKMSTKCVYVFHLTFLQDIHKVCLCVPRDSPAGCLKNVFMCSIWLSRRMSTKCVYALHVTLL